MNFVLFVFVLKVSLCSTSVDCKPSEERLACAQEFAVMMNAVLYSE